MMGDEKYAEAPASLCKLFAQDFIGTKGELCKGCLRFRVRCLGCSHPSPNVVAGPVPTTIQNNPQVRYTMNDEIYAFVIHFRTLERIRFRLPPESLIYAVTLYEFLGQILRNKKSVDLGINCTDKVELATVPENSENIEADRSLIDTDFKLQEYLRSHHIDYKTVKTIYLFELSKKGIIRPPTTQQKRNKEDTTATSSNSGKASRDSVMDGNIISHSTVPRWANTCAVCNAMLSQGVRLFACHLLEIKSLSKKLNEQTAHCNNILGLADIRNYLCLCKTCHDHFDEYNIAIDPSSSNLIVSPKILDEPINKITYRDLVFNTDGKPTNRKLKHVDGEIYRHPSNLVQYRYRLYQIEQQFGILSKQNSLLSKRTADTRKRKATADEEEEAEVDQEDPYKTLRGISIQSLSKMKKESLKDLLRSVDMSVTGNVPHLRARLTAFIAALVEIDRIYEIRFDHVPFDNCTCADFHEAIEHYLLKLEKFKEDFKVCKYATLTTNGEETDLPFRVKRYHVPKNGNCFFESIAALLRLEGINGMYLRALMVAELKDRLDDYRRFFSTDVNIPNYIRRISQGREWVDGLAMSALRNGLVRSGLLTPQQMPSFFIYHEVQRWVFSMDDANAPVILNLFYNGTYYEGFEIDDEYLEEEDDDEE